MAKDLSLFYKEPAWKWPDALPIGNGKFGAMVFGQVRQERWQLNEDSVWYGEAQDRNPKDALKHLPALRSLLAQGRLREAEDLADMAFVATPESQRHFETLGLVNLLFPHTEDQVSNYERYLDLENATQGLAYTFEGVEHRRELFASYPANVIAAELSASQPGKVSFKFRIIRQSALPIQGVIGQPISEMPPTGIDTNVYMDSVTVTNNCLVMKGSTGGNGVRFCLVASVTVDGGKSSYQFYAAEADNGEGSVKIIGETIIVDNASTAQILLAAETTFRHDDPEAECLRCIEEARKLNYPQLKDQHFEDYHNLFSRVDFRLGSDAVRRAAESIPTNERMTRVKEGALDVSLTSLYYQFGRYLLISSSRPGHNALPANLQGIWNERMDPTWGSKFTINVNAEMNYWLAESTNLSECHEPFFSLLQRLRVNGQRTARQMYGCNGWTAHHNTDIWADSAPQDRCISATVWPMGGAWASTHTWQHFDFTGDIEFLAQNYQALRGSVEFFLDFLTDHDGYKVTNPSLSPENSYRLPNGEEGTMCIAPTMDGELLYRLFTDFLDAHDVLGIEDDIAFAQKVKLYRKILPPFKIGRYGQLQEWYGDYEELEPGHRHFSHLWALYPSDQITLKDEDSALVGACKRTLERRAAHGGGHTGWSRAWMIALWARLGDGAEAAMHITELLRSSTYDSLLDNHPPFQIDGNLGATAAITEMLIQSHGGEIYLLPALPPEWSEGSIKRICARGGFEISLAWSLGLLKVCSIRSRLGKQCVLKSKQILTVLHGNERVAGPCHSPNSSVCFQTSKGEDYSLVFD